MALDRLRDVVGRVLLPHDPVGPTAPERETREAQVSKSTGRPTLGSAVLTPTQIARTYRKASREAPPELPWGLTLTDDPRLLFREGGRIASQGPICSGRPNK